MKITVNNTDSLLVSELNKICDVVDISDEPNGIFLQWVNTQDEVDFYNQTKCIEYCIDKNVPLIIFDEYQKMTVEEITFLLRPGVFLWESYLNDRMFFSYQPNWGKIPSNIEWDFDETRPIDFGCVLPLKGLLPTFKKYYQPLAETGEFSVVYSNNKISNHIRSKISDMGVDIIKGGKDYIPKMKMSMILGTDHQYKTGHFPSEVFRLLEKGIVPLLPEEHKWYYSIFQDLIVTKPFDIEYLLNCYDNINYGLIHQVYENLDKYLPESNVVNVAKRIKSFIE